MIWDPPIIISLYSNLNSNSITFFLKEAITLLTMYKTTTFYWVLSSFFLIIFWVFMGPSLKKIVNTNSNLESNGMYIKNNTQKL